MPAELNGVTDETLEGSLKPFVMFTADFRSFLT
jgi:hypothetical protein